jgi:large subunit ribosomal protein L10
MPKQDKIDAVNNLKQYISEAGSMFITDYTGLNVADITILRKNLRENSIKYLVAKNTLLRIAAKDSDHEEIVKYLNGQTAIAFGTDDPAVPAKILYDFFKKIEKPVVRAFVLDEVLYTGEDFVRLAELPSKDVLLSVLIATVESPLTSLVGSLDGVFQEFVSTLDALVKAKG